MTPTPDADFPLEINGPDDSGLGRNWPGIEPQPTSLIALWPDDQAPTQTEVFAALAQYLDQAQLTVHEPEDLDEYAGDRDVNDVQWMGIIDLPPRADSDVRPIECIVWSEPAMPVPPGEYGVPEAEQASWIVGFEFMLDQDDPLSSYIDMMQMVSGSLGQVPGVLDPASTTCLSREMLDEMFLSSDVEPGSSCLWTIHAVAPSDETGQPSENGIWLHTHGLERCGLPELELIEIPGQYVAASAELLEGLIDLLLDCGIPAPGTEFEIGSDIAVVFQPWQDVAPYLRDETPGSMRDREDPNLDEHLPSSAVVCAVEPRGQYREVWSWPEEVIARLHADEAVMFKTRRATERQATLARSLWDELATGFAALHDYIPSEPLDMESLNGEPQDPVRFLVKAGFVQDDADDTEGRREHLWFELRSIDGDRIEGYLINKPLHIASLEQYAMVWMDRAQVSDWLIVTPEGSVNPSSVARMWDLIDDVRTTAASRGEQP